MKTAIVLFNLGGPGDLASVEPFLVNLFSDREIIELPFGAALQPLLGPAHREDARTVGPEELRADRRRLAAAAHHPAQAAALEARLNAGLGGRRDFQVFIAMRYSRPSSADALEAIAAAGIQRIVTLTLFPHWSRATTGSSRSEFGRALADPRWSSNRVRGDRTSSTTPTTRAISMPSPRRCATRWNTVPAERRRPAVILFSAHGLPQKFIDEGDPYVEHIQATRWGILERLNLPNRQLLAYQSRTGPVKWLGPGTEETIEELGREGVKDVFVVPLSFVSDHIETLYEVDMLFADAARDAGITGYYRPPALNTHPLFIEALAGLVRRHDGLERDEALALGAGA